MATYTGKTGVRYIPKVGPKFERELERFGIKTVSDLLYHFPFRYNDYSNLSSIAEAKPDEIVSITGTMAKPVNVLAKNGRRLTISQLADATGRMTLIWFNQQYLRNILKAGEQYSISGKVSLYNGKKCIFAPEYEEGEGGTKTGRLIGVYPASYGISSKFLRSRINDVIPNFVADEFLPEELLIKYGLPSLHKALMYMHSPTTLAETTKARERFAYEEMLLELLGVQQRKSDWKKTAAGCRILCEPYKNQLTDFIAKLPFALSPSQHKTLVDIFADFEREHPMNRLLEGDVGSGKTVVSLVAAYVAYLNGYKTVLMAPTEILATQHYATFTKLFNHSGVKGLKLVLKDASAKDYDNSFDIAIGTHALLYTKQQLTKLGLVVIDEQHRFGVEQRTFLLESTDKIGIPNMLAMTATPIPRTLALTLYGDLDISTIDPHTSKGRNVVTKVVTADQRAKVYDWLKSHNQQTFIVCPFIQESENADFENVKAAESEFIKLKKIVPADKVALIHGRMPAKDKNHALDLFRTGKITYLVSTPVVEVGIDVPDAAVIVIESAERYGLASLHQLRGRVGRRGDKGFCFLMYSGKFKASFDRLKHMERIANGLELAELDLKLRGQGDIYGTMQSGIKTFKIANVYDIELLQRAKEDAELLANDLNRYPALVNKLMEKGKYIGNN
ncbi:MAG: ATP-dependent DNA helicase RecG [candidate division WWE3 bacterium GW2011_GWC2_44_9]|uniref:Probable DNA 3'-5' helicase RecG n=1 Tax=candidate division WWE3 bacterium GW2011_GWC2_44_9 TaxID=1619125 RepID=A0A0G1KN44_UNCKA|nr:MAG: ATP-dependent DNA helicase RecG [candidate division WWE3 bacterium GW2011_GWC2_44_9]